MLPAPAIRCDCGSMRPEPRPTALSANFARVGVPFYRSHLVPLEQLASLLIAVDVHLVTLRDAFVGYVLPSKIHACIESGKRILFIGSQASDVHRLAAARRYRLADIVALTSAMSKARSVALKYLEHGVATERKRTSRRSASREPTDRSGHRGPAPLRANAIR